MEMQYKPETEKMTMIDNPSDTVVVRPLFLTEDPQIKRTRDICMTIIGVFLGLSVLALIATIFGSKFVISEKDPLRFIIYFLIIISILYYSFGLFVSHRYLVIGIRIFAWLEIIALIINGIIIVVLLFIFIKTLTIKLDVKYAQFKNFEAVPVIFGFILLFICIAAFIASFVFMVINMIFAFKLARFIDAKKHFINQQI